MDVRLSDAELDVMNVLWASDSPLSATDVADAIGDDRKWSLATVKTLLSRLLSKQAIAPARDGRRFLYTPCIVRDSYVGAESRRFVDRLFGGRLSPLIVQLAEEDRFSSDDVAAIEALLARLRS